MSQVYFASAKVKKLAAEATLPAKFKRLLDTAGLAQVVKGKKVCIKLHMGAKSEKLGFTTIHPLFVRVLVDKLKEAGAKGVFLVDESVEGVEIRGYTEKGIGAPLIGLYRRGAKTRPLDINFKTFDQADVGADIFNADVLLVFSHVKGHGDAGFGGAGKNIAMGCVTEKTRQKIHALEGGIAWDESKCKKCMRCIEECPNKASKFTDDGKFSIFWHNCKYCRHCVLSCEEGALTTTNVTYEDFQEGMGRFVAKLLGHFGPENTFFINVLLQITIFCDCWGFSTPALVPDIGILASRDIVSIDKASLDLIKAENLLPNGLPEGWVMKNEGTHLFEKLHGKNPYLLGEVMERLGVGKRDYTLKEIE